MIVASLIVSVVLVLIGPISLLAFFYLRLHREVQLHRQALDQMTRLFVVLQGQDIELLRTIRLATLGSSDINSDSDLEDLDDDSEEH